MEAYTLTCEKCGWTGDAKDLDAIDYENDSTIRPHLLTRREWEAQRNAAPQLLKLYRVTATNLDDSDGVDGAWVMAESGAEAKTLFVAKAESDARDQGDDYRYLDSWTVEVWQAPAPVDQKGVMDSYVVFETA